MNKHIQIKMSLSQPKKKKKKKRKAAKYFLNYIKVMSDILLVLEQKKELKSKRQGKMLLLMQVRLNISVDVNKMIDKKQVY